MTKKIFIILMMAILAIQGVAFAKKKTAEIPQEDRLNIAIAVTDATNFTELKTAEILADMAIVELHEKKLFNIVGVGNGELANIKTLENVGASDVGDLITFPTKNLEFENERYKDIGADYVIYCEILGLGYSSEDDRDFGFGNGIGVGIGTGGIFGIGVNNGGILRKFYCTAVSMQIIEVESGAVLARQNFIGKAIKHHKPRKGYDNVNDEAYLKSLNDAAEIITKNTINFAAKNFKQYAKLSS